jgi:hypothetical protein
MRPIYQATSSFCLITSDDGVCNEHQNVGTASTYMAKPQKPKLQATKTRKTLKALIVFKLN